MFDPMNILFFLTWPFRRKTGSGRSHFIQKLELNCYASYMTHSIPPFFLVFNHRTLIFTRLNSLIL